MTQAVTVIDERLGREAAHFDAVYSHQAEQSDLRLSETDKVRYNDPPGDTIYPREYFYHLLKPLAGKSVLEIACGNGIDACITAHNGAHVHAYDISGRAIELTRQRAAANGLTDRVALEVTGVFDEAFDGQRFDAITGYAALHHLPLAELGERVHGRLRPGGVAVFAEPVVNSRGLAAVRRMIPYRMSAVTDDETPLDDAAIAHFARPFDRFAQRHFQCVSRIWPMVAHRGRLVANLHRLDAMLMKAPMLRRFASVIVFAVYRDR